MADTVFDLKNSFKNLFPPFSSVFAFKQAKVIKLKSKIYFFLNLHFLNILYNQQIVNKTKQSEF